MTLSSTLVFYFVIGLAVTVAVFLRSGQAGSGERALQLAMPVFFWPMYVPLLLGPAAGDSPTQPFEATLPASGSATDEMARSIALVESELQSALKSLDGWCEDVLLRERERLTELRHVWSLQAARIRELDELLAQPQFLATGWIDIGRTDESTPALNSERIQHSEQSRWQNIERLRAVRRRLSADLMGTLAWVRELVTMIHLAKFTGAPASRTEDLISQIAAAVEGLSEVSHWPDEQSQLQTTSIERSLEAEDLSRITIEPKLH